MFTEDKAYKQDFPGGYGLRTWQAFWEGADGKRHSRKFSIRNMVARAKQLACQARQEAISSLGACRT